MNKISKALYQEFVAGHTWFDWIFLLTGVIATILIFFLDLNPSEDPTNKSFINLLCGVTGVLCVVLGAQGKISNFVFGFIQVIAYLYIALAGKLYGQVGMSVYYFITMVYGVYTWMKQYKVDKTSEAASLTTRKLSMPALIGLFAVVIIASLAMGWGLAQWSDDSQPYYDAFATMPAIIAQLLMIGRFREQWYLWLLVDVMAFVMWIAQGNLCMAAMYAFWCANCIYGFINWTRELQKEATEQ